MRRIGPGNATPSPSRHVHFTRAPTGYIHSPARRLARGFGRERRRRSPGSPRPRIPVTNGRVRPRLRSWTGSPPSEARPYRLTNPGLSEFPRAGAGIPDFGRIRPRQPRRFLRAKRCSATWFFGKTRTPPRDSLAKRATRGHPPVGHGSGRFRLPRGDYSCAERGSGSRRGRQGVPLWAGRPAMSIVRRPPLSERKVDQRLSARAMNPQPLRSARPESSLSGGPRPVRIRGCSQALKWADQGPRAVIGTSTTPSVRVYP